MKAMYKQPQTQAVELTTQSVMLPNSPGDSFNPAPARQAPAPAAPAAPGHSA